MHPTTMNPFILVIDAVTTIEFNPDIGDDIDMEGTAKNWISYVCIWTREGSDITFAVDVIIVVEVELRVKAERMFAFVWSIGIV